MNAFFTLLLVTNSADASESIDDVCLTQHLKKIQLLDEKFPTTPHEGGPRRCQKYISSVTENYYKFWKNHWKNQTPISNSDESIKCFMTEMRKYNHHDRYLLEILLREQVSKLKNLLHRNSIFYERLLKEFEKSCDLKGYYYDTAEAVKA